MINIDDVLRFIDVHDKTIRSMKLQSDWTTGYLDGLDTVKTYITTLQKREE